MPEGPGVGPDLTAILTREEFAAALTRLRTTAGLTVRQVVEQSGALHGTVSGWFAGQHLPTESNERMFREVLCACGVRTAAQQLPWLVTVRRIRPTAGRRRESGDIPYRGLAAFGPEDAEWFFGRAESTAELCHRVAELRTATGRARLLFVIGASGSGKSSLLCAGLAPRLRAAGHSLRLVRPGTHPAAALAAAEPADVVVIDQFEEAWTLCRDLDERARFFAAIDDPDGSVHVLGLRADFFRHAAEEPVLQEALGAQPMLVRPFTEQALREVIVEPARKAKWTVDDDLVQLLTVELAPRGAAAAHDAGALPLLSHALLETWRHSSRRRMTVADYVATGGITGAIQQSAEAAYTGLTGAQQDMARRTLLRLVTVEEDTRFRRRVQRRELCFDAASVDEVDAVIERFAAQRLLTVAAETVEISHEALIGSWARLAEWVDTDRTGLLVHRKLTQATQVWLDADRDPSALLGANRLALMREWAATDDHDADLNRSERDYLAACVTHHEAVAAGERRRTRILQRLVAGLAAALVIAIVLAAVALTARSTANRARDQAQSRQIALQATSLRDKDPALSAQLALAAYRVHPTLEARSALLDSSAIHTPVRLLGPAGGTLIAADASGSLLAVGRQDGSVLLYRPAAHTPPRVVGHLPAPSGAAGMDALAVDRSARVLARATGGRIELWDIVDPEGPWQLAAMGARATAYQNLAFSPDGRELAAGTIGTTDIPGWDLGDPAHPNPLPPWELPASGPAVAYSPDGRLFAAGGHGSALRIWDRSGTATPLSDIASDGTTADVQAIQFAPDSGTVATAGRGNDVRRWRIADPAAPVPLPALTGFASYVNDLTFSPDGRRLVASSSYHTTRIWLLESDTLESTLPAPGIVVSVRFAADGATVVTGGLDGAARIWSLPGPVLQGARASVYQMPVDRTGTRMLVGTGAADSQPRLWDLTDPHAPLAHPPLGVGPGEKTTGAVALALDGSAAAVGSRTGRAYLWDLRDPAHPRAAGSVAAVQGVVGALTFSPDAGLLVVLGQDHRIVSLWDVTDLTTPHPLGTLDVGPGVPSLATINPSGTLLAIATSQESVRVWDIRDRTTPRELPALTGFANDVASVAFAPVDDLLAAAGADRTVRLFSLADPERPQQRAVLDGPVDAIITVNFSPDARHIAGGGGGNGIWLWDITDPAHPTRVALLTAYNGRINEAVYLLGGTLLAAAGPAMIVRLWATDPALIASQLCTSGSTPLTPDEWARYLPGVPDIDLCAET
ncbi:WD40 repeat domain-containing protein [Nocardia crassostreae]|uniref:WD40 repeat domain-containing protein n=1 Tax=Nocardia crassostreae TaxID=53428 RepID=UPI00082BCF21|nr:WD40 repeat domain-containing protein [Nocardia crassostreae]